MTNHNDNPRYFFENHVRPNYQAYMDSPLEEHLAKNTVAELNNMADWMFIYSSNNNRKLLFGAKTRSEYRDHLTKNECQDFALVRDVADAHKHVELTRSSRRLTRASQTNVEIPGGMFPPSYFAPSYWARGYWGPREQFIVTLDTAGKRPLSKIIENVVAMWERLLTQAGL